MNIYPIAAPHIIGLCSNIPSPAFPHPTLAAFRSPSFIPTTLLETHLTWWLIALALSTLLLFLAHQRNHRPLLSTGAAALTLSILWIIAAFAFDTPAERLYNAHRALADAGQRGDVDTIVSFLAPDVTISALDVSLNSSDKQHIADVLKDLGIKETQILSYRAALESPTTALTDIHLITSMNLGPFPSNWHLHWSDIPDQDWKITRAQYLPASPGPAPPTP